MKKIILIVSMIISCSSIAFGQSKPIEKQKQITISGYVPDSVAVALRDTLNIFLLEGYQTNQWHEGVNKYVRIINNRFSVTFQPNRKFAYIKIRGLADRLPSVYLQSLEYDAFLVSAGDNLNIHFNGFSNATVTGKGSEAFKYQQFAGDSVLRWGGLTVKNTPNRLDRLEHWRKLADNNLRTFTDTLNKIKPFISNELYRILWFNTISGISQQHLDHLTTIVFHAAKGDSLYLKAVRMELQYINFQQRAFVSYDPIILENSANYISYLADFQHKYIDVLNGKRENDFRDLYNKIVRDYSGTLRDKILALSVTDAYERRESEKFVKSALAIVQDPESKKILEKIYKSKTPGVEAYDFSFADIKNRQVKLKDLRGKVVVIEAYFNGCSGCVGLASRMHPIIERYKNNPNIVFISLSVDETRETFLKGVKSGIYGSESSIYLNTNGKGWEHPICQLYGWMSYPQMLLIDKNGKIITAEKIDPITDEKKAELITLLDKNLSK